MGFGLVAGALCISDPGSVPLRDQDASKLSGGDTRGAVPTVSARGVCVGCGGKAEFTGCR